VATDEKVTRRFPLLLTTGRILSQYNVGAQTRRTPNNQWHSEDRLEIHPHDAEERGIRQDDWVGIESRAGHTVLRAVVTERVQPGVVYTTFHFPESGRQRHHHRQLRLGHQLPRIQGHRRAGDAGGAALGVAEVLFAFQQHPVAAAAGCLRGAGRRGAAGGEVTRGSHAMQMYELPVSPFAPVAGSRSADVTGVRAGRAFEGTDWVAEEVPVALEYNGVSHAVMLASPADLEDFALGFTLTEGIVDDVSQILDIELTADARGQTLHVRITAEACFARLKDKRRSLAGRTGCGLCGADSLAHAIHPPRPVLGTRCFAASAVARALAGLRDKQLLRDVTGATHAAAWCSAAG
jgi:hypothetical protein